MHWIFFGLIDRWHLLSCLKCGGPWIYSHPRTVLIDIPSLESALHEFACAATTLISFISFDGDLLVLDG
jgi:hypothetical protein